MGSIPVAGAITKEPALSAGSFVIQFSRKHTPHGLFIDINIPPAVHRVSAAWAVLQ